MSYKLFFAWQSQNEKTFNYLKDCVKCNWVVKFK